MISFLQRVLQKHHKWLFSILLVIVTISFVFTVGSSPGIGRSARGKAKKFFGFNLSSQKDMRQLLQEVELSAQLQQVFIWSEQLQEYAMLSRLAALKLADDFDIPVPDRTLLLRFIENYPMFAGKNRQFDASKYNQLLEQFSKDPVQLSLFERTISNDFRIDKVEKLLAGQGYCLDGQARFAISQEMTKYSFSIAKFDASILTEDIQYEEDEIKQYFEDHGEAYKVGEQIVLDYVEFPSESFAKRVPEPSRSDLQKIYNTHPNQFKNLVEGSDEWRTALTKIYKSNMSEHFAMETANQFIYDLYEKNIPRYSNKFNRFIEDRDLTLRNLGPIVLGQFSNNEYFPEESLAVSAKLSDDRYYSDPLRNRKGNICILLYKDMIPAFYPPLENVRENVVRDFLAQRKEEVFANQVDGIQKTLAEMGSITPEIFTKIVTAQNGTVVNFNAEIPNNLTIASREKEALLLLSAANVSPAIFTGKMEAKIVFLEKKESPDTVDPLALEQRIADLEKKNKRNFNDYIVEMILDEVDIKENRPKITQQYKMAASLIYMQRHRDEMI
jgi:peptidyl-prolyl cis-trans isomerase D